MQLVVAVSYQLVKYLHEEEQLQELVINIPNGKKMAFNRSMAK